MNAESRILTRRELQIMKVVWKRGAATVREVHSDLAQRRNTSRNTVLTLIRILERKGVLFHTRIGRAYLYEPLLTRRQATRNQVRDIVARFFDGQPEKLIENILQNEATTPGQLEALVNLVESRMMPPPAAAMNAPASLVRNP